MSDDLSSDHEDAAFEAYEAHRTALMQMLSEFAEQQDIDEGLLAELLLEAAVSMSALDYALSVAKPSESGLKMQFDRFQRGFGDLIRLSKKDARNHLARMLKALDEAAAMASDGDE